MSAYRHLYQNVSIKLARHLSIQYTGGFAGEIYTADNLLKFIGKDNESRVVVTMADTGVNGKIGTMDLLKQIVWHNQL